MALKQTTVRFPRRKYIGRQECLRRSDAPQCHSACHKTAFCSLFVPVKSLHSNKFN